MKNWSSILSFIFLLAFVFSLTGCRTIQMPPSPTISVPDGVKEEQIENAIVKAMVTKKWEVLKKEPGKITAVLNIRKHQLTHMIKYNAQESVVV